MTVGVGHAMALTKSTFFCVKKTSESRRLVLNIKAGAAKRSASAAWAMKKMA